MFLLYSFVESLKTPILGVERFLITKTVYVDASGVWISRFKTMVQTWNLMRAPGLNAWRQCASKHIYFSISASTFSYFIFSNPSLWLVTILFWAALSSLLQFIALFWILTLLTLKTWLIRQSNLYSFRLYGRFQVANSIAPEYDVLSIIRFL